MNSKVIKWFMCQTGVRKADKTEGKKGLFFKARSNTLRKLSYIRSSLRKRHKRRLNPTSDEEIRSSSSSSMYCLSLNQGQGTNQIQNNEVTHHLIPNPLEIDKKKANEIEVEHLNTDSNPRPVNKSESERESSKQSNVFLQENLTCNYSPAPVVEYVEDSSESSGLEASSSDSVETIKRVDNFKEDWEECEEILAENSDIINNINDITEYTSNADNYTYDISSHYNSKEQDERKEPNTSLHELTNTNHTTDLNYNASLLEKENRSIIRETEFSNILATNKIHEISTESDLRHHSSHGITPIDTDSSYINALKSTRSDLQISSTNSETHRGTISRESDDTSTEGKESVLISETEKSRTAIESQLTLTIIKPQNDCTCSEHNTVTVNSVRRKDSTDSETHTVSTDGETYTVSADTGTHTASVDSKIQKPSTDNRIQKASTDNKIQIASTDSDTYTSLTNNKIQIASADSDAYTALTDNKIHEVSTDSDTYTSLTDSKVQNTSTNIETKNALTIGDIAETSTDNIDKMSITAGQNPLPNGNIANPKVDKEEVPEYQLNESSDCKSKPLTPSSNSLSNSTCQNETIAIFDDDGDISAVSPSVENGNVISNNKKLIENNVKQLKKLKFQFSIKPENKIAVSLTSANSVHNPRKSCAKDAFSDEEVSKVKIVITKPSPKKSATIHHSKLNTPVSNGAVFLPSENYPEELNPFGDDSEDNKPRGMVQSKGTSRLQSCEENSMNPFGSDSEDDNEFGRKFPHNSRENEANQHSNKFTYDRKQTHDKSNNPFEIYEDVENSRLSITSPFAADTTETVYNLEKNSLLPRTIKEDPPNLPPKLDYRSRQNSLSSAPIPHPRKTKQRHHGSANSLNSNIFPPVAHPRSFLPSGSAETLNSGQEYEERSNFVRGRERVSLPASSRYIISKKKRVAPCPPNQIQKQRSVSSDGPSTRGSDNYNVNGATFTADPSTQTSQPPPRPPPPKMNLVNYKPNIKEKFLRII